MNEIVRVQRSPVEEFVDTVLPPDRLADLAREMPSHIRPDLFKRNLLNALMINWDLMECDAGLLFREVSKAAGLGLYLDPALGEAYIIISKKEPQLRIGYRGVTKLARQSGTVSLVYAHEVRENDFIDCDQGSQKRLTHKPKLFSDRGTIIGFYAVITFSDGAFDFETMSLADVRDIRDRSDAWKAFKANKIRSTPWVTDESEMAKKTVIRRLMKRAPQSPELAEALRIEDQAEGYIKDRPATPVSRRVAPSASAPMIEHQPEPPTEHQQARDPQAVPQAPEKPTERRRAPSASQQPVKPEPSQAPTGYDPEKVRARFAEALKTCKTEDDINEAWMQIVDPVQDGMFPPDRDDLERMIRMHRAEIEGDEGAMP